MHFKSHKSIVSSLAAVFSKAWVLFSMPDWDSSHGFKVVHFVGSSRSWNKVGAITLRTAPSALERSPGVNFCSRRMFNKHNIWETTPRTKQLSQPLIRGGPLRGRYAVISFSSVGGQHGRGAANTALMSASWCTGSLFNLIAPFVSSFKREEKQLRGLYIRPSTLLCKTFHLYLCMRCISDGEKPILSL